MDVNEQCTLNVGWGHVEITPEEPVVIRGQFHARVSEGVRDPITSTTLLLQSRDDPDAHVVFVSCDLVQISEDLSEAVRAAVHERVPQIDPAKVVLNATHTHSAPEIFVDNARSPVLTSDVGVKLDVIEVAEYVAFAADRIANAVQQAWERRSPGGFSWGMTLSAIGHGRRWSALDGSGTMYGDTSVPGFSHIQGRDDHTLNIACTWNRSEELTGIIVNVPCPSQVSEAEYKISADFWHETRAGIRQELGAHVHVLAQCAAAGDLSPRNIVHAEASERMRRLRGEDRRQEIARQITESIAEVVPLLKTTIEWDVPVRHKVATGHLARRVLTIADVAEARVEANEWRRRLREVQSEIDATPPAGRSSRWYVPLTRAYRRARWYESIAERYARQQAEPTFAAEVHAIRIGDMAFASNPFEYFSDYGLRIQVRSEATQTFVVQLAGPGSYLPTEAAMRSGGYSVVPSSTIVGPEGGTQLADLTIQLVNALFES